MALMYVSWLRDCYRCADENVWPKLLNSAIIIFAQFWKFESQNKKTHNSKLNFQIYIIWKQTLLWIKTSVVTKIYFCDPFKTQSTKKKLSGKRTTMVFCYQNCSDLLWEKIVVVIEKIFWNSRLKAENLQNFWDH